jgi:hypothetical protein
MSKVKFFCEKQEKRLIKGVSEEGLPAFDR